MTAPPISPHTSYEEQNDTIRQLVETLDLHDPGEGGHSERVAVYATSVGHAIGLTFSELLDLRRAASLHDIGKVSVNPETLRKLGELDESEIEELRAHALFAMDYVESYEWLQPAIPMIRHHHERFDGTGYPDGLSGTEIPLGARIIAVCETYDVLLSGSPWRRKVTPELAMDELKKCAGSQFDPEVVRVLDEVRWLIQPVGTE